MSTKTLILIIVIVVFVAPLIVWGFIANKAVNQFNNNVQDNNKNQNLNNLDNNNFPKF